jgi:branched-chain amino acid aminotransferase
MSRPLVYFNGNYTPDSEVQLSLDDAGFLWGATVTDRCRTFGHQLFRLADHLRRFRNSCQKARVPQPIADSELAAIAHRLVEENARLIAPDQDLTLVMFATPGPLRQFTDEQGVAGEAKPTLCVHTFPIPFARYAPLFRDGARLLTPAVRAIPRNCLSPSIKHRSRLHWWLAEEEVHTSDAHAIALLLDSHGHLTETAIANFLLVRAGQVLTPRAGTALPGVSLHVVSELCSELGIPFTETDIRLKDCAGADEAMLSCTSYCLAPVAQLNETRFSCPGPIFERLLAAWNAKVGLDIRQQFLSAIPA